MNSLHRIASLKLGLIFLAAISLLVSPMANADKKIKRQYVNLVVGLTQDFKLDNMPSSPKFEGDFRKVTRISYAKEIKTIRFNPKKTGSATLTVQDNRGRVAAEIFITVRKSDLNKTAKEIQALLRDIDGVEVKIINNKVVVDGQVLLPKDLNRVYSVVAQYGAQASSIVTLSTVAQKKIAEIIERDINNPEIHVRSVNGKFIIEGVANNEAEKQRSEIIAKTYVPDIVVDQAEADGIIKKIKVNNVINLLTVKPAPEAGPGKIIQLVVHFVELQKDYQKGFRFQWTPNLKDGTSVEFQSSSNSPGGIISSITGTISNLLPKLNWAKQHGYARVLQSSSVIVQDGEQGKITSTTRIPYQIVGEGGVPATAFEEAGLVSEITPKIIGSRSDSIRLVVNFNVKDLLGMSSRGPLTSNRTLNTTITVRSRQSAAIGGLVSNQSGTNFNKLPRDVSSNPLFSLYASKDFRREQSQFVVFITPVIKSSASAGSERIKRKFRLRD